MNTRQLFGSVAVVALMGALSRITEDGEYLSPHVCFVSSVLTERRHSGGWLVSEETQHRSRDQITMLQQVVTAPAAAPTLSAATGGSGALPSGTLYVKTTFVSPFGESAASPEANATITGSTGKCTVTALTAPSAPLLASGYNVYAAFTSGQEQLINATPIALGTGYEIDALQTLGFPPSANPASILPGGVILGQVLDGASAAYTAGGSNTGNFTASAVTVSQGVVEGTYTIEFIAATVFNVYYPNGTLVGEGHTGSAFSGGGLGFTLTAGGTPAVAGDNATIALATNANAGLYAPLNLLASDGTQNVAAVLFNEIDVSQANRKVTVISRAAQANGSELTYPAAATAAQITAINAQLQAIGVIVR